MAGQHQAYFRFDAAVTRAKIRAELLPLSGGDVARPSGARNYRGAADSHVGPAEDAYLLLGDLLLDSSSRIL